MTAQSHHKHCLPGLHNGAKRNRYAVKDLQWPFSGLLLLDTSEIAGGVEGLRIRDKLFNAPKAAQRLRAAMQRAMNWFRLAYQVLGLPMHYVVPPRSRVTRRAPYKRVLWFAVER